MPTTILSIDISSLVIMSHNILPPYVHCDYPPRQKCIMNEGPLPRIDGHTTIILIFSVMSVISKHSQSTALPGNAFTISHIIAWKKVCGIKFWYWYPQKGANSNKCWSKALTLIQTITSIPESDQQSFWYENACQPSFFPLIYAHQSK